MDDDLAALKEVVDRLNFMLEEAGVDFAAPVPRLAWEAFKGFAQIPIRGGLGGGEVSATFVHLADMDDELWVSFSRDVRFVGEDGETLGETAVGCHFSRVVSEAETLYAVHESLSSSGFDALQEYFDWVESHPLFSTCMQLPGWKWEETQWPWIGQLGE